MIARRQEQMKKGMWKFLGDSLMKKLQESFSYQIEHEETCEHKYSDKIKQVEKLLT